MNKIIDNQISNLINDLRFDFMKGAFFANAWHDASQHVKIYLVSENDYQFKNEFREYLKERTYKIIEQYQNKQFSFDEHTTLIYNFFKEVNTKFKDKVSFSFGCSQKLINVLLKYYWCADKLNGHIPAHMPLDSFILQALNIKDVRWTQMDYETYQKCIIIAKATAESNNLSLSEWELKTFKEVTDASKEKL